MALVKGTNCGFVTVAPTSDPGEITHTEVDNHAVAIIGTTPAGVIKITEIGWWCDTATEAANFEVAIYVWGSYKPGAIIGVSRTNAKGTSAGWKRAAGLDITLEPETKYYIAVQLDNTNTTTYSNYSTENVSGEKTMNDDNVDTLPDPWTDYTWIEKLVGIYALVETEAPVGTNIKINIADDFKDVESMKINIGDVWKDVAEVKQNIGDAWKVVY